jgi:Sec-independent protein translocase protein TatA
MAKLLFIFLIFLVVAGIFALRYRRQIQSAIYVWQMFKKMRGVNKPQEKQIEKTENTKDVQLVRCGKCGTWIPQKNALNLRSKAFYCSADCIESAVKV